MGILEAEGRSAAAPGHEARGLFAQVLHRLPKQLLGHLRGPFPVGVGKSVAAWGRRPSNGRPRARVQLQGITQVIQADAVSPLRRGQTHHMAPRLERARLVLRPGDPCYFRHQMLGNKIANLAQDAELGPGWGSFALIHPCRGAGAYKQFQPNPSISMGRLWIRITKASRKRCG